MPSPSAEPVEVTREGERLPVVDGDGLEHAVAHDEPVVEHAEGRFVR
jgi:hypothetical protein